MIHNPPMPNFPPNWEDNYSPELDDWANGEGEPDIGLPLPAGPHPAQREQATNGNGHQQSQNGTDKGDELDLDELVKSAQIPLKVTTLDVPYVKPVSSSEALEPLDVSTVIECMRLGEYGDALLFGLLYEGRVCYDHVEGQWYLWRGHYWEADTSMSIKVLVHGQLAAQYILAAGALKQQVSTPRDKNPYACLFPAEGELSKQIEELIGRLWERGKKLRFKSRRNNILDIAQSLDSLVVDNRKWDANPWLLGCQNGVISLSRDDAWFRNGQPSDYIRTIAPTTWQGLEYDSILTSFIPSLFDNQSETDKQAITSYLKKLLGYGLTGLTREDTFAILWGDDGRNGKDTLLKMVEQTLGPDLAGPCDKAVIIDSAKKSGGGTSSHIMALRGKRLTWVNETKEGEVLSAGQVKYLTGGGTVTGREVYQKQAVFEASHLLLLLTNFKPHANADDKALWERISLVPFELRFVAEPSAPNERKRDATLKGKLTEERKSGVLAYLVAGCLEWQRDGLLLPDCLKAAKAIYQEEEDTLGLFVKDCCVTGRRFRVDAKGLYDAYAEWASDEGSKPMSNTAFGRKMKKRFKRKHSNKGKVYEGLKIKSEQEVSSSNDGLF